MWRFQCLSETVRGRRWWHPLKPWTRDHPRGGVLYVSLLYTGSVLSTTRVRVDDGRVDVRVVSRGVISGHPRDKFVTDSGRHTAAPSRTCLPERTRAEVAKVQVVCPQGPPNPIPNSQGHVHLVSLVSNVFSSCVSTDTRTDVGRTRFLKSRSRGVEGKGRRYETSEPGRTTLGLVSEGGIS